MNHIFNLTHCYFLMVAMCLCFPMKMQKLTFCVVRQFQHDLVVVHLHRKLDNVVLLRTPTVQLSSVFSWTSLENVKDPLCVSVCL